MNKFAILESLSRIIDKLQSAIDEIEDIVDNEVPKSKAQTYLLEAEMEIYDVIDEFETLAVNDGSRSGAI